MDAALDGRIEVKRKTSFVSVEWRGASPDQPQIYLDEIDDKRWSIRCIRIFTDGTKHAFHGSSYKWRDQMPETAIPPLAEINTDPQFVGRRISREVFEKTWNEVYGLNQQSMLEPILDAMPEFRPQWDAFVAEWADNPHHKSKQGLPLYLVISTLAKYLADQLDRKNTAAFPKVFATVENWLTHGEKYVVDAAGAGLLEDLQNPVHYTVLHPDDFKPWFGAETLRAWERLKAP
jgi:hypothetical protein